MENANHASGGRQQRFRAIGQSSRETREHWNDTNSLAFEQEEILPLLHAVKLTIESTQLYGSVVRKAQHACDPDAYDQSKY